MRILKKVSIVLNQGKLIWCADTLTFNGAYLGKCEGLKTVEDALTFSVWAREAFSSKIVNLARSFGEEPHALLHLLRSWKKHKKRPCEVLTNLPSDVQIEEAFCDLGELFITKHVTSILSGRFKWGMQEVGLVGRLILGAAHFNPLRYDSSRTNLVIVQGTYRIFGLPFLFEIERVTPTVVEHLKRLAEVYRKGLTYW